MTNTTQPKPELLVAGAGKMGGALLQGALAAGWPAGRIRVIEPHPSPELGAAANAAGFRLNPVGDGSEAGILLLAIKPQMLDSAAGALEPLAGPGTSVLSILAGKSVADLAKRFPRAGAIVRAMPNTPAAIGRGITGGCRPPELAPEASAAIEALLATAGEVVWFDDEAMIDAVTAVSGSGPAYVFHLVECLAEAGRAIGLPADIAARLARATIEGAGELLHREKGTDPATLRTNVTSPGGTTAAALAHLMAPDGLAPLMARAVTAARDRARELAG